MNHYKIKTAALVSSIVMATLAAHADAQNAPLNTLLLPQRCVGPDVTIDKDDVDKKPSQDCFWSLKNQDDGPDMQITMHIANDVDKVSVICQFDPAYVKDEPFDKIVDVSVSKAATSNDTASPTQLSKEVWSSDITDASTGHTDVSALVTNYKNNLDFDGIHHQANIIFDLNKERKYRWLHLFTTITFHDNDKLECTFSAGDARFQSHNIHMDNGTIKMKLLPNEPITQGPTDTITTSPPIK